MFILHEGNNVWINMAAIFVSWIVLSFTLLMIWIALIEINLFVKNLRTKPVDVLESDPYFDQIEEIRNDFN